MSVEAIKAELKHRWGQEPVVELCLAIIDFMSKVPVEQLQMLTFASFKDVAKKNELDSELLNAVTILTSSKVAALDTHAMLVDDDDREHEIPLEYLAHARLTGEFIHPETGEPVQDFEARVFPFFVPSATFLSDEHDAL